MNEVIIKNRFELSLCEICNPNNHGQFSDECYSNYITIYTHKRQFENEIDDEYDEYWEMNEIVSLYKKVYKAMPLNKITHPFIRNHKKIMKNENYIQPEIVEKYFINMEIRGNFYPVEFAIKKTVWIRIIQRAWKRVYAERCRIIQMIRKNPSLLLKRQTNVKFHTRMPSFYGMLASLKG